MEQISQHLYIYRDTCNVYVVRQGDEAVLVDFGDGGVLDELDQLGVRRVTDILITHHHRDQCQGLSRALERGINCMIGARVWAPHAEQELFHSVDLHWQSRRLMNNYDVRQDRFSLLEPIPLAGTLLDYARMDWGGKEWTILPTPGHTPGSVTLMVDIDGWRAAFTGDLIAGPGKVWSMAALQWSYQGMEGAAASIPSLRDLQQRQPDRLLPSHGEIMDEPQAAVELLAHRLRELLDFRRENLRMEDWLRCPYEVITPHLLLNRTSVANSYVLLSESGKALLIDYGYDFVTTNITGAERAVHRPWLYTLDALKRDYGVQKIDAVIATHYHDDHVAGFNLLRRVEGTQVWAASSFAEILQHPERYDLPCLWYDPIQVDRILPLEEEICWEEYRLTLYALPGHTRYAVAIAFEADGQRILATGDQHKGNDGLAWNYVYQNRFEIEDYRASAELYARVKPDLILPGHWKPLPVSPEYLEHLREHGDRLAELHRDLLPLDTIDLGGEGSAARINPYQWTGRGGEPIDYLIEVRNPLNEETEVEVRLSLPPGWRAVEEVQRVRMEARAEQTIPFQVIPPEGVTGRRFRLAAGITAGDLRLGQQAEALVDLI